MTEVIKETKRYIEMHQGGRFFPEDYTREITEDAYPGDPPPNIYAYRFYSQTFEYVIIDGKRFNAETLKHDETGWHYINGEVFDADSLPDDRDHRILRDNMRCNDWPFVVRCNLGNYQPFHHGKDVIVHMDDQP